MNDDTAWFAPKRYGYGSGWPIQWQGWAVLGAYLAVVAAAAVILAPLHLIAFGAILSTATAVLIAICAAKTRGGWRWRWGS
ncbi:MAG TPA: hypothetical protein VEZ48_12370 [Sphingomonadaceae bacterium]|nr:hypothetical protein [Sphingomonadaceae bacterium]